MKKIVFIGVVCALALIAALSSCATAPQVIYRDRPVPTNIPVPQPCVEGPKPAAVVPLKDQFSDAAWAALDTKQKAAYIAAAGLAHKTATENLNGATTGCH